MSLMAPVQDGKVIISETSQDNTERKTGSSLDKEDFLMLLVAQMKYQDPLEPESNTEYVAQLAQFSELEQMQNLNSTTVNTSAYTLVGKQVYIEQVSDTGEEKKAEGMVEYVTMQNGEPYVSVNGELYAYADIVKVIDETYLISQYIPHVEEQSIQYLHWDSQDVEVKGIEMGSKGYEATSMAIILVAEDGKTIQVPVDKLTYEKDKETGEGKLTINKSVFAELTAGNYVIAFVFDDANKTVDYSSVTLTVKGNPEKTDNTGTDDNTGTGGNTGSDDTQG